MQSKIRRTPGAGNQEEETRKRKLGGGEKKVKTRMTGLGKVDQGEHTRRRRRPGKKDLEEAGSLCSCVTNETCAGVCADQSSTATEKLVRNKAEHGTSSLLHLQGRSEAAACRLKVFTRTYCTHLTLPTVIPAQGPNVPPLSASFSVITRRS